MIGQGSGLQILGGIQSRIGAHPHLVRPSGNLGAGVRAEFRVRVLLVGRQPRIHKEGSVARLPLPLTPHSPPDDNRRQMPNPVSSELLSRQARRTTAPDNCIARNSVGAAGGVAIAREPLPSSKSSINRAVVMSGKPCDGPVNECEGSAGAS